MIYNKDLCPGCGEKRPYIAQQDINMSEQLTVSGATPNLEVTVEQAEAAEALDKSTLEPVHDSAAIEQQMVKEEQDRLNKEPDQEELACMMLKLYTPRFNALIR